METNRDLLDMNLQYFADDNPSDDNPGTDDGEAKQSIDTITKDEANRLISQNKSKAKEEAEKSYQKQLDELTKQYEEQLDEATSKLGEKDKEEFDLAKAKRQLDELQKQLDGERLEKESLSTQIQRANMQEKAIEELTEKKLPVNETVLKFVVKNNAENTLQAIEDLSDLLAEEKNKYAQDEPPASSGGFNSDGKKSRKQSFDQAKITGF